MTSPARNSTQPAVTAALLAVLLIAGGGGSPAPLSELICELAAVLAVASALLLDPDPAPTPRAAVAIAALLVIPPLLQLVPLPPALWQALPARAVAAEALGLAGQSNAWQPLSIAPHRTLASLLSLGPPLAVLWLTSRLDANGVRLVLRVVAAVTLLGVLVGAAQLATAGSGWLDFYRSQGPGEVFKAFHANRNSAADILLVGIVALCAVRGDLRVDSPTAADLALAALVALLLLALFLTGSRTGMALAPIALGCGWLALGRTIVLTWRGAGLALVALCLLAVGAWLVVGDAPAAARVVARFQLSGEFRPELWRDAWHALWRFWPLGSGLGTFDPAFLPSERLEVLDPLFPNRAHNELLELAIEGGVVLLATWALLAAITARRLALALRAPGLLPRRYAWFAASTFAVAGLHSLVDYPFRSMAMAALVALGAGLVAGRPATGLAGRETAMKVTS